MDEISYWIYTKRAPCLMNYDNLIKKQNEDAQCSKEESKCAIYEEVPSPKKRKKRKLSLLEEDSVSTEKQQNVYFEVSQNRSKPIIQSSNSESLGSDVDFNIKNTSVQAKRKRTKLQKNSHTILHKKNKVVTSTPKTTVNLRRSLRQAQLHNNLHMNSSFGLVSNIVNGAHLKNNNTHGEQKPTNLKQANQIINGEQHDKRTTNARNKTKNTTLQNGQFEDLSDVSGFTANYIRSTKVQSKTPRKIRGKPRNLVKESQEAKNDSNLVMCVTKSTDPTVQKNNVHNYSTDSSQNIINVATVRNSKTPGADKGTPLSKFMDTKKCKNSVNKDKKNKNNLNISFQSQSSTASRYPKRNKCRVTVPDVNMTEDAHASPRKRRNNKTCIEFNNSDKKENPEEQMVTRMRSGRNAGLTVCQRENSILVVSNSTEQVGSMVSNAASPNLAEQRKKRRTRQVRQRRTINASRQTLRKDSLRNKSGFAACFSDSEDDLEPLKQRKYFCT